MARGFVFQAAKKWSEAADVFLKVVELLPDDNEHRAAAQEEHAWCLAEAGEPEAAIDELQSVLDLLALLDGQEPKKARVCWRIGACFWRLQGKR